MDGLSYSFVKKIAPHPVTRWFLTAVIAMIHGFRAFYYLPGFGFVTYLFGHYFIFSFFKFLKPDVENSDGTKLAIKPFIRKLPEFKFWRNVTVAVLIAFVMTFFSVFDDITTPMMPCEMKIFWTVFFLIDMVWQLADMIKYKYIPITLGKKVSDDEEEFKPFIRKLPEFKFWGNVTVAVLMAFAMTFFLMLVDIVTPGQVIFFWIVFFLDCMIFKLADRIKYKYIPITFGKKKYEGKKHAAEEHVTGLLMQKHVDAGKKLTRAAEEFAAVRLTVQKHAAKEHAALQYMMQEHVDVLLMIQKYCGKELADVRSMIQEHGCKEHEHVAPSGSCAVDGRNE